LYCLLHFVRRFGILFLGNEKAADDMGFDPNSITTLRVAQIFLPHIALQLSGFAFDIPKKRYRDGFRIWPQYRWEVLVFVTRTMSLMAVAWYRKLNTYTDKIHPASNECSPWLPLAIVLAGSMGADTIAQHFAKLGHKTNTLRDINKAPPGLIYLAASAQFHANIHCLLTQDRLCVQVAALMVIQVTSFLMTLRRKGVINVPVGIALYGVVLIVGMVTIVKDLSIRGILGIGLTLGNVAAVLRFDLRLNKYVLWVGMTCLLKVLSTQEFQGFSDALLGGKTMWRTATAISFSILWVGATRRQNHVSRLKT
jgi:hypothetical protein